MTIAFDVQHLLEDKKTGIGYHTEQLIRSLLTNHPDADYLFNFFAMKYAEQKISKIKTLFSPQGEINPCTYFSYSLYKMIYSFVPLPPYRFFFDKQADVYHFFNFIAPPFVPGKIVLSIHDMVFKDLPETVNKKTSFYLKMNMAASIKRADALIVVSRFTQERLAHYYNTADKQVVLIPNGVDLARFHPAGNTEKLRTTQKKYGIQSEYFIYVGTIEPRKNLERLIKGYAQFARGRENPPQLVLVGGKGWLDAAIFAACDHVPPEGNVLFTGYLDEDEIPEVLRGAIAMCFPSLYEGFGLPVLEAMACGTAVLTSHTTSLGEVAGNAAHLVNPLDEAEIAAGMVKLYEDKDYRNALALKGHERAQQFTWDAAAQQLYEVYKHL